MLVLHTVTSMQLCSGFVLSIVDVIQHMFSNPVFAKHAGVRTRAMLESPFYARLDAAHDGALSALTVNSAPDQARATDGHSTHDVGGARSTPPLQKAVPVQGLSHPLDEGLAGSARRAGPNTERPEGDGPHSESDGPDVLAVEDPDPSDEFMTGAGPTLTLLFGLFVDGVQLHASGESTTTVVSLKCLDLPGFLVGSKLASYNLGFVSGPKEPTCMTDFLNLILKEFKAYEPAVVVHPDGKILLLSGLTRAFLLVRLVRFCVFATCPTPCFVCCLNPGVVLQGP